MRSLVFLLGNGFLLSRPLCSLMALVCDYFRVSTFHGLVNMFKFANNFIGPNTMWPDSLSQRYTLNCPASSFTQFRSSLHSFMGIRTSKHFKMRSYHLWCMRIISTRGFELVTNLHERRCYNETKNFTCPCWWNGRDQSPRCVIDVHKIIRRRPNQLMRCFST